MNDSDLDNLIRAAMQPPRGLEDRVLSAVREDSRRARKWRTWRIALAAAACLALFVLPFALKSPSSQEPRRLAIVLPPQPPLTELPQGPSLAEPTQPLRLAGNAQARPNAAPQRAIPKELPHAVRHIWLVQNLDEARQLLRNLAEDNHIPFLMDENAAILRTTDQTAQSITDFLSGRSWELLSPELPQPRQHSATRFTGKTIDYIITPMENKR